MAGHLATALLADLRPADRAEVETLTGGTAQDFLPLYLNALLAQEGRGSHAYALFSAAHTLAGVCGVAVDPEQADAGLIWMVGTREIDRRPLEFLRASRAWMAGEGRSHEPGWARLHNIVDARNTRHMDWLCWLGFEIDPEPQPHGADGLPFHGFHKDLDRGTS